MEAVAEERPTDVHALDFKSVGTNLEGSTRIGLVYDFSDYKTLRKYLKEGRVSTSDSLSHDGDSWTPIGDITDLEAHFIDVFVGARAGIKATAKAEVQEEAAEMEAVDAGALADDLLERMSTSEEEKDTPTPVALPEEDASADDIANQLLAAVEAAGSEDGGGDGRRGSSIWTHFSSRPRVCGRGSSACRCPQRCRRAEGRPVCCEDGNDDHNLISLWTPSSRSRPRDSSGTRRASVERARRR